MIGRQKILIVDDKKENLFALRHALDGLEVEIIEAQSGNEALAATLDHDFALVILDIMMPGMDGYELAGYLKGDAKTRTIPIIFLTAVYSEEERIFKGYEAGAVDYIVKPYNPTVLTSKVRVFLELDRARAQLAEKIDALTASENALRESEERFRIMADGLPLIIWVHDVEGIQQFVNRTFCEFFGVTREEMHGNRWQMLLHPDDASAHLDEFFTCIHDQRAFHAEVRVRRADGQWRWIESWANPRISPAGDCLGFVGTSADVTERKQAEELLRQLNETLEQKVSERTRLADSRAKQLQFLAVELLQAEETERQRIAQILHDDLQQLLAAARMQLEWAAESQPNQSVLADALRLLDESIKTTRNLSHELSPAVMYHSNFSGALEWLANQMEKKFGLQVQLETHSVAEPENMPSKVFVFRAISELLFNIVKHAGVKHARIVCTGQNNAIKITVSDEGKGFDPGILNSFSAKTGLGLLSLRERASYIGGRLIIESAPGNGSRFTLTVPHINQNDDNPHPVSADRRVEVVDRPEHVEENKIRVLFADDHEVIRRGLISMVGEQPNIQVVGEAADGREALELAQKLKPDVVVADMSMPILDGVEATRQIKSKLPDVRVIGLSMHDDGQVSRAMIQAGAETVISKTAALSELLNGIYGLSKCRKEPHGQEKQ